MSVKLYKHECVILGLCEIFYHKQYTQLTRNAIQNMLYLLSRKNVRVKAYSYVCSVNGPYSAELDADLIELDEKRELIVDFYDSELTVHAVSATYLAAAECVREMLQFDKAQNVMTWAEMLATLSCLTANEQVNGNSVVVCNQYVMTHANADYEAVKRAWQLLEDAKMTFMQ